MYRLLAAYLAGYAAGRWRLHHYTLHTDTPVLNLLDELAETRVPSGITMRRASFNQTSEAMVETKVWANPAELLTYLEDEHPLYQYFMDYGGRHATANLWVFAGAHDETHHLRVVSGIHQRGMKPSWHPDKEISLDSLVKPGFGAHALKKIMLRPRTKNSIDTVLEPPQSSS
jgi:hypothetical protein